MTGNVTSSTHFAHGGQAFDLNVEKVLEHWSVAFAIRELIANALDEQAITRTREPGIFKDDAGYWHIADAGRGIRYEHLTQNENAEKRSHPGVIGQFGMGLKDALAVFDRRGVGVAIYSPHAVITTGRAPTPVSRPAFTSKDCSSPRNRTSFSRTTSPSCPRRSGGR
jgi:hypothetical protein